MKILFFIIAGFFFIAGILFTILSPIIPTVSRQLTISYIAVTGLFILALVIFYLIMSIRILKRLSQSQKMSQRKRRTKKVTNNSKL
jgi:uncharacterized protein HemY